MLNQLLIPITMAVSFTFLNSRYGRLELVGAMFIVVGGVLACLSSYFSSGGSSGGSGGGESMFNGDVNATSNAISNATNARNATGFPGFIGPVSYNDNLNFTSPIIVTSANGTGNLSSAIMRDPDLVFTGVTAALDSHSDSHSGSRSDSRSDSHYDSDSRPDSHSDSDRLRLLFLSIAIILYASSNVPMACSAVYKENAFVRTAKLDVW